MRRTSHMHWALTSSSSLCSFQVSCFTNPSVIKQRGKVYETRVIERSPHPAVSAHLQHRFATRSNKDLWSSLHPHRPQALQKEGHGLETRASNKNPEIRDGDENPETWKGDDNGGLQCLSTASSTECLLTVNNCISACAGCEVSWFEAYVLSLFHVGKR